MNTMELLNTLPTPTWRHLGVNAAPQAAALPEVPAEGFGKSATAYDLPEGVACTAILPQECTGYDSGLGQAADRWIHQSANFSRFFRAEGTAEAPAFLRERLDAAHPNAVTHTAIHAKAGSAVTFVQVITSDDETAGLSAALTQICAEAGSRVTLIQVQLLNEHCRRYNAVAVKAAKDAAVKVIRADLGAAVTLSGARALLPERQGAFDLQAIYYGDGENLLDFNDIAVHTAKDTHSELHTAGVLADKAQKVLRGTIDFQRGAVNAVGHESEDVLLFSPTVRNRTAPLILCGEEQVEGQHAATSGRLDEGLLYYLQARGLNESEAKRLMVQARFAPVLDEIPDEALRQAAEDTIARRLEHAQIH